MAWHVYMLECADGTIYTGSTNDVERRIKEHNESVAGAKYTRSRRPVALRYVIACKDKGEALKREAAIKRLPRSQKLGLFR